MNEASLTALLLTLQYASLAIAIVFIPCMLIAYVLARFSFPGKVFISAPDKPAPGPATHRGGLPAVAGISQ